MKAPIFSALLAVGISVSAHAASLYVGDVTAEGAAVPAGAIGPDTAGEPPGNITYAFFAASNAYTNTSGIAQIIQLTEVNFFSASDPVDASVTPFVAVLLGGGTAGADYNVLAKGDPIDPSAGLNNAVFSVDGLEANVTLDAGAILVAGFNQSVGMIPWEEPIDSDGDFLVAGDQIPESGALTGNAEWSNLGREYRFNIGFEATAVPEPSVLLFLVPAASLLLIFRRRRSARA